MSDPFGYGQTYVPYYQQSQQMQGNDVPQQSQQQNNVGYNSVANPIQTQGQIATPLGHASSEADIFKVNGMDFGRSNPNVDPSYMRNLGYTVQGVAGQVSRDGLTGRTQNRVFGEYGGNMQGFNWDKMPSLPLNGQGNFNDISRQFQDYTANMNAYYGSGAYDKSKQQFNSIGQGQSPYGDPTYMQHIQSIQGQLNPLNNGWAGQDQALQQVRNAYLEVYNRMAKNGYFGLNGGQ